jgi:hypothetical protein
MRRRGTGAGTPVISWDTRTTGVSMLQGGRCYKVVHQNCDHIVVEAEFDNFSDAAACLAGSVYMDPFIVVDRGDLDLGTVSPEEARRHAVERIEFRARE